MPELKNYGLFISHAWNYNSEYYRLEGMLHSAPYFNWRNYSVPEHDPLINPNSSIGRNRLASLLDNQVRPVNCVLIVGGMYAAHSDWILTEIEIAQYYNKPIIGIYPSGQERFPVAIQNAAVKLVGWSTGSIVSAIREYSI
ncbi:MAG: TIR domain-containing protein [Bacteroidia bacterium]